MVGPAKALMCREHQSMIMTTRLAEMSSFCRSLGANPMTSLDGGRWLIANVHVSLSRNYRCGFAMVLAKTVNEARGGIGESAEGVNTLKMVVMKLRSMAYIYCRWLKAYPNYVWQCKNWVVESVQWDRVSKNGMSNATNERNSNV